MNYKLLVVILMIFSSTILAQEEDDETLVSFGTQNGGFIGVVTKVSAINNETACFVGARGGLIHNHFLGFGAGIYALTNYVGSLNPDPKYPLNDRLSSVYAGAEFEYIFMPKNVFHWSVQLLVGGGGVFFQRNSRNVETDIEDEENNDPYGFFVLEPQVNFHMNITHFFHADAGVSYRLINGLKPFHSTNAKFSGLTAVITFRFGQF